MTETTTPKAMAESALERKKFSFADAIRDRSYPQETVEIYLDEARAFPLLELEGRVAEIKFQMDRISVKDEDGRAKFDQLDSDLKATDKERIKIKKALEPSKYTVTVRGVNAGFVQDVQFKGVAEYPIEYETYTNDLSGQRTKEEIPNPAREMLMMNLIWQGHIIEIQAPDGSVDTLPDIDTISSMRRELPVASRSRIESAIERVDMAVDWYRALADESFLAKS